MEFFAFGAGVGKDVETILFFVDNHMPNPSSTVRFFVLSNAEAVKHSQVFILTTGNDVNMTSTGDPSSHLCRY